MRQGNHKSVNKVTEQDSDEYEDILTVGVANPETVKKKKRKKMKRKHSRDAFGKGPCEISD